MSCPELSSLAECVSVCVCVCVCVRQRVGKVMCIYKLIQSVLIVMLFLTELLLHVHETIVSYHYTNGPRYLYKFI